MTDPRHAQDTDFGRYYTIPGIPEPLVSVTNAISVGLSKGGLPRWYANSAAEAAWEALPQMVLALRRKPCRITPAISKERPDLQPCGECVDCVDRWVKEGAERKRDWAAELGTRAHALAEAHVLGRTLPEEEWDATAGLFVAQYLKFLKDFDVDLRRDIVASEATVADRHFGYAGTGDLWVRLPFDGFLWEKGVVKVKPETDPAKRAVILVDLKTSLTRSATQSYPENVMQLAALRHAKQMVLPDDSLAPNVRVAGTATLQLRQRSYALIPLPSGQREFALFQNVLALAQWLHHEWPGEYEHRPILPSGRFKPKRGQKES